MYSSVALRRYNTNVDLLRMVENIQKQNIRFVAEAYVLASFMFNWFSTGVIE